MTDDPIDVRRLARAIRFALVAVIVGLSYFGVRASLSIDGFRQIFLDMLGAHPLPGLTVFVIQMRAVFIAISLLMPTLAIGTLFWRNLIRYFHLLGCLALLAAIHFVTLYHALSAPLAMIIEQMGGSSGR